MQFRSAQKCPQPDAGGKNSSSPPAKLVASPTTFGGRSPARDRDDAFDEAQYATIDKPPSMRDVMRDQRASKEGSPSSPSRVSFHDPDDDPDESFGGPKKSPPSPKKVAFG